MRRLIQAAQAFFNPPKPAQPAKLADSLQPPKDWMENYIAGAIWWQRPPRQYCNWAAEVLGYSDHFTTEDRITPRVHWLLYQACKQELDKE